MTSEASTGITSIDPERLAQEPHQALAVQAFGLTDKGRVRPSNEDQFLVAELSKAMGIWQSSLPAAPAQVGDERGHLFLVADGMGGHRGGEQASALAVVAIQQFTLNTLKWFFESDGPEAQTVLSQFQKALSDADAHVRAEASEHEELSGMGTTVTLAYHLGTELCIVHVGDSRAYLYRDSELQQLTRDHTFTADLVRSGALQQKDVAGHRYRHVITNVVGGHEAGVKVEAHAIQVQPDDRLLLCSDGLTEMVTNEAIAAALAAEPDPEGACATLVRQANDAGGPDNITVVVVKFEAVNGSHS